MNYDGSAAFDGKYTKEEFDRIMQIGGRPDNVKKPDMPFFKKNAMEFGPSWAEKREFVHWLINESTMSPASKTYLRE